MADLNLVKTQISHDQRKKIFALAKDNGITNDQLHDYMVAWSGTSSLAQDNCTSAQANKIIEALQKMQDPSGKVTRQRKAGDATEKQVNAIKMIAHDMGWNDAQLNGFIKHTVAKQSIEDLKVSEATQVITGLKMLAKTPVKSR